MKIKTDPASVYCEYNRGVSYNSSLGLYDTVERNENFYNDKQWEGVYAPKLTKPVFNFLKPVVNYYIATLISDDIAVDVELDRAPLEGEYDVTKIISSEIEKIIEHTNMRYYNRRMLRNCAVDGDACFYVYFDPDVDTGHRYLGEIKIDLIDNTNIIFGNPSTTEVSIQPYIIIVYKSLTEDVRDEAKENGLPAGDIQPDTESRYTNAEYDTDTDYTTVFLKMWREKGEIHMLKCTKDSYVKKPWNTGQTRYPVSYMTWESVKNSYHGTSPITGKIQNQIFVNKLYAMSMAFAENQAFPKILYDRTKIPEGWRGNAGEAVAVVGDPREAIFSNFQPAATNGVASSLIDSTIKYTKDLMGASDAALGNVTPDNTSAIVAVQKASSMPLDIQRMDFYNFIESTVRIFIDIMQAFYGVREFRYGSDAEEVRGEYDFSELKNQNMQLTIDIGQGSYWSELTQISTLDNLMANKIIPDAVTYLEAIPDGYIKNKQKIIDRINALTGHAQQQENGAFQEANIEQVAAQDIQQSPMIPEMSDEELSELLAELSGLSPDKQQEMLDAIPDDKISPDSKEILKRFLEGSKNGQMQQMRM